MTKQEKIQSLQKEIADIDTRKVQLTAEIAELKKASVRFPRAEKGKIFYFIKFVCENVMFKLYCAYDTYNSFANAYYNSGNYATEENKGQKRTEVQQDSKQNRQCRRRGNVYG